MSAGHNLAIQIDDAILIARIHRAHAIEVVEQSQSNEAKDALVSANAAVEHADNALVLFREALGLLPDLIAARDAKLRGDIILLESGSALITSRQYLETT
jgi:hypothetical protein